MSASQNGRGDGSVQSVERAMSILEMLGLEEDGLRLTDVAERTQLSVSTVHRLLTTLQKKRFVEFDRGDGLWHVGRQCFSVGATFVRRRNFVTLAMPFLRELRDKTRETANLGIIEDAELVTLAQVESREIMRATSRVGGRSPVYATGMGKAILSTYPYAAVSGLLKQVKWLRLTERTIVSESGLFDALKSVAAAGYAVDDEEYVAGLRCVAAPVFDQNGEVFFAISVSGLATRMSQDRLAAIGELISSTAAAITSAMAGH